MESSLITGKGQTTVPKRIREQIKLKRGDRLYYVEDAQGHIQLQAKTGTFRDLIGILPKRPYILDEEIEERMGAAIAADAMGDEGIDRS
ncbi:MAG: AbrB/MazE/SpoVT family DNA-binding domain-containing protein [Opitutales bacterium]